MAQMIRTESIKGRWGTSRGSGGSSWGRGGQRHKNTDMDTSGVNGHGYRAQAPW